MKWDIREPCKSCPYRKDAKLGFWSAQEFFNLEVNDARDDPSSPIYACHGTVRLPEPTVCAGWLMDQRKRRTDNMQLRITIATNEDALACYLEVDCDAEMFDSIQEMVQANHRALLAEEEPDEPKEADPTLPSDGE